MHRAPHPPTSPPIHHPVPQRPVQVPVMQSPPPPPQSSDPYDNPYGTTSSAYPQATGGMHQQPQGPYGAQQFGGFQGLGGMMGGAGNFFGDPMAAQMGFNVAARALGGSGELAEKNVHCPPPAHQYHTWTRQLTRSRYRNTLLLLNHTLPSRTSMSSASSESYSLHGDIPLGLDRRLHDLLQLVESKQSTSLPAKTLIRRICTFL